MKTDVLTRRRVMKGLGAIAAGALAGCTASTVSSVNDSLRYGYAIEFDGDQMAVNVDGTIGDVGPGPTAVIEVRVYVGGSLEKSKQIEVPITDKHTDWGVSILIPRTEEEIAVEAEAVEVTYGDED